MGEIYNTLLKSEGFLNLEALENDLYSDGSSKKEVFNTIGNALLENSSLKLKHADMERLGINPSLPPLVNLIHAKEIAKSKGPNIYISCMPKSGSSFLAHSIANGLNHSFSLLTSSRNTNPSYFGINPREQELCELALIKNLLVNANTSIVAQHHTKASPYTVKVLSAYNFRLIVLIRNIFDVLVSADDMWMNADMSNPKNNWSNILPLNYNKMKRDCRYKILAQSLGIWCIQFYVSWLRQKKMGTKYLEISYDTHIALDGGDKIKLAQKIKDFLILNSTDAKNLTKALIGDELDEKSTRFNKGTTKRGKKIPAEVKRFLVNYTKMFSDELNKDDYLKLFGKGFETY